jgi:hypothetical protein
MAKNQTELHDLVLLNLPDNTTEAITPAKHREVADAIIDSYYNTITDTGSVGLCEYDTARSYKSGCGVFFETDIYQATVTGNTTVGTFIPSEWEIVDSSSAVTANFIIKDEGVELDAGKKIVLVATDSSIINLDTGFYQIEANAVSTGLGLDYPILGKASLQVFKGQTNSSSLHIYTPFNFTGVMYVRNLTDNWVKLDMAALDLTYKNGIQKIGSDIELGGQFSAVSLVPQTISSTFNILGSNVAGAVNIDVASTSIKGDTTISRNNNAISVSSSNVFLTSNSEVEIFNLKPSNIATYKGDFFGSSVTTADNNIPSFKMVKNFVDLQMDTIALGADYVNGLTATTVITSAVTATTVGLGGNLDSDVNIDLSGSSMSFTGSDTRLRLQDESIVAYKTNEAFDQRFSLDVNDISAGLVYSDSA